MAKNNDRPFVDTNVLFSGFYSPNAAPAQILRWHAEGTIRMVISRQVLDELITNFRQRYPNLLAFLQLYLINSHPEIVADPEPEEVEAVLKVINLDDAPILAAALKSGADCIISGNTRHFTQEVAKRVNMAIYTPNEYVAFMELE